LDILRLLSMTSRILPIVALVSLAAVLEAQPQGTIDGPVAGYVFDKAAHALRPVLGLPGASSLGSPMNWRYRVDQAFIAPKLDSAVGVTSEGAFRLFRMRDGIVTEMAVGGLASASSPYSVAFSPSGSSVALYAGNRVQLISGLPDAPAVGGSVDLTAAGVPFALAVSDDARGVLVSVNNSIRFFESYADMGKLIDTAPGAVVAFAAGGHDAAVADSGAGVVLFRDVARAGVSQVIVPPDENKAAFSAVAFSADGQALFLASAAAQAVTQLDLAAGSRTRIPCSCSPTVLARMGSVFRVTELTADPLWLLDAPESAPRVVFVPAYESLTAKE
jgi:hypothetical protein